MTLSDEQSKKLADAAVAVRSRAHAPYSNFPVGAAVLDDQGRIHVVALVNLTLNTGRIQFVTPTPGVEASASAGAARCSCS